MMALLLLLLDTEEMADARLALLLLELLLLALKSSWFTLFCEAAGGFEITDVLVLSANALLLLLLLRAVIVIHKNKAIN